MAIITADYDYLSGHLRYGHEELELFGEELEKFKNSTEDEQIKWLKEEGETIIDDLEINDKGDLGNISITE